jgi:DNA-binding CsgD family transcriptional regulator
LKAAELAICETSLFAQVQHAAACLGFEHCAYGLRLPLPLSSPRMVLLNNYPRRWRERYAEANYIAVDPTVQHARRTQAPLMWNDAVFGAAPELWDEAQAHGLKFGWAQSTRDANGIAGMLTLSRSGDSITSQELEHNEIKMRWLVNVSHLGLSRLLAPKLGWDDDPSLTKREVEVLKWTADGKTAGEISDLLSVSENTVNFHVKNAVSKLQSANKTAAVVRAAMLGLLN